MSAIVSNDTDGLSTHGNDLAAKPGSTSVADNVSFSREGRPERRIGFKNYSTNLPDAAPLQLLTNAAQDQAYLHLDGGIWYNSSGTWLRKRGVFGAKSTTPYFCTVVGDHLYYTANSCVMDLNMATGALSVLAGRTGVSSAHTDGTGDAARFRSPYGICSDGSTYLYVVDSANAHCVSQITIATGATITIAGNNGTAGNADGTGPAAEFSTPIGITYLSSALYVCDFGNDRIRKITGWTTAGTGVVTTIAGDTNGTADGTGTASARFTGLYGITNDGTNLYVCDASIHRIRKIAAPLTTSCTVTTIAGNGAGSDDGTGTAALFTTPISLTYLSGNLYVTDGNHRIRKIAAPLTTSCVVTTIAGSSSGSADGIGTAGTFNQMYGLDDYGNALVICDTGNNLIRKLYLDTTYVSTISGIQGTVNAGSGALFADGIIVGPSE